MLVVKTFDSRYHDRDARPRVRSMTLNPGYTSTALFSSLVEETKDLSGNVLPPGLLVVHDTGRGSENDVAELTGGKQLDNPLLEVAELDVVAGRDNAGLVDAAVELDDDLCKQVSMMQFGSCDSLHLLPLR